jgi:hypothetical protein
MTARKGKNRERPTRQKIRGAIGLALGIGAIGALAFAWHHQTLRRWQAEREKAEDSRQRNERETERARQGKIAELQANWSRTYAPSQPDYELLQALARITPTTIVLRELRCDAEGFRLSGHVDEHAERPDSPLLQFCRDLAAPEAPWQLPSSPEIMGDDFACRGVFRPKPSAPDLDQGPQPAVPPHGADPAAAGEWEARLSRARAALLPTKAFDESSESWNRHWTLLAQSAEAFSDLELRHYALAYNHPTLQAWSDIVQMTRQLCAEPGVTIDRLVLAAAPDAGDNFTQAQINLTARLRR